jgi:hypothetical protein
MNLTYDVTFSTQPQVVHTLDKVPKFFCLEEEHLLSYLLDIHRLGHKVYQYIFDVYLQAHDSIYNNAFIQPLQSRYFLPHIVVVTLSLCKRFFFFNFVIYSLLFVLVIVLFYCLSTYFR